MSEVFFGRLSASASLPKNFAIWTSEFSSMMAFRNWLSIYRSMTLYKTERISIWALWYDVRRMSSHSFPTSVVTSSGSSCSNATFTSSPVHLYYWTSQTSLPGCLVTSSPCPWGTVPGAIVASSLRTAFHDGGACRSASLGLWCRRTARSPADEIRSLDCPSSVRH